MLSLGSGLYSVGVQDAALRTFDIIMRTPHGTSYNAFVLRGSEKTVLIETVKEGFHKEYFRNIEEIVPIEDIDYLVVNHTEPDHAGTIPLLLERNPGLTVLGSSSAIAFLTHLVNAPFKSQVVKTGDTLNLGDRELSFYPMPNLHWPDTMFTFDPLSRVLFTCDCFGAHFAFPELLLSRMKDPGEYIEAQVKYFHDIISPFATPFALNGVRCARELKPRMICTGHGPILDVEVMETLARYEALCHQAALPSDGVVIIYVSAYGYTASLAETIAEALRKEGVQVKMLEATATPMDEMTAEISRARGILFGSPTFLGDILKPIAAVLAALYPYMVRGKVVSAFGSYGWSGEAVPNMLERLRQLKANCLEGLRVRLKPDEEDFGAARDFARTFIKAL